jgi:hypothetical protein
MQMGSGNRREIRKSITILMAIGFLLVSPGTQMLVSAGSPLDRTSYLPLVFNRYNPLANQVIANAPYFAESDIPANRFSEMAIFWFGQVSRDSVYTDVRLAYNDDALWVYSASFDRRLWYNPSSDGSGLEDWDGATLLLDTGSGSAQPAATTYRFVSQFYAYQGSSIYQRAYRGTGSGWGVQSVSFSGLPGWRGNAPNDDLDDRGWAMTFRIPFSSLGLSKPADGTTWRLSLQVHNRNSQIGPPQPDQVWPDAADRDSSQTWGRVRFGLPTYKPPSVANAQQVTIRGGLNGAVVPDAAVGGGAICGDGLDFWTQWGSAKYAGKEDFNIQNQSDVADWPCFSKYYATFPLDGIPGGKAIRSATLVLHEFGGADPTQARPSLIQVLRVGANWSENSITWNNAPLALENVSRSWVAVYNKPLEWPGDPYSWDVSAAAAEVYNLGQPLRLALYSADSGYHSGKYFVSSDTGDWNATGRPTLVIQYGDP